MYLLLPSLLFFLLWSAASAQSGENGLTLYPCDSQAQCQSSFDCAESFDDRLCKKQPCACLPKEETSLTQCVSSNICRDGEGCLQFDLENRTVFYCADCRLTQSTNTTPLADACKSSPSPTPEPSPSANLVTGESCTSSTQCVSDLVCAVVGEEQICSSTSSRCWCIPEDYKLDSCLTSSDCTRQKEGCISPVDSSIGICAACAFVSSEQFEAVDSVCGGSPSKDPSPPSTQRAVPTPTRSQAPRISPSSTPVPVESPSSSSLPTSSPSSSAVQGPASSGSAEGSSSDGLDNSPSSSPSTSQLEEESGAGNLERCRSSTDCATGRFCLSDVTVSANEIKGDSCTSSSGSCLCVSRENNVCSTSEDCLQLDRCMKVGRTDYSLCISCNGVDSDIGIDLEAVDNGNGNCPVCIAASMLSEFGAADLVYRAHRRAQVLCDMQGSCATEGHMVVYRGDAMMMETYCERVDVVCRRVATVVNSPRMRKGLRVASRTDGLEFTALAARFGTKVEEMVLGTLLRGVV